MCARYWKFAKMVRGICVMHAEWLFGYRGMLGSWRILRLCTFDEAPRNLSPPICCAEDNLDDAANEGAMNVIIPLLKSINGGDDNALNFPKTLYVVWRGRRGLRRPAVRIFVAALVDGS